MNITDLIGYGFQGPTPQGEYFKSFRGSEYVLFTTPGTLKLQVTDGENDHDLYFYSASEMFYYLDNWR